MRRTVIEGLKYSSTRGALKDFEATAKRDVDAPNAPIRGIHHARFTALLNEVGLAAEAIACGATVLVCVNYALPRPLGSVG